MLGSSGFLTLMVFLFSIGLPAWGRDPRCTSSTDVFANPFNKNSAFHRPIGSGADYAGENDNATKVWLAQKAFNINQPYPYGAPFAAADAKTLDYRLTHESCPTWNTNPTQRGFPVTVPIPNNLIPGNAFKPCADGTAIVYDRPNNKVFELYEFDVVRRTASTVRNWDILGLGHGTKVGERIGTSASGIAVAAGSFRVNEVETAGMKIEHAFHIVVPRKRSHALETKSPIVLGRKIQWPATGSDNGSRVAADNTGPVPYGSLLAIPPENKGGPNLRALGLSEAGLRFAEALRNYGVYVVDGGGAVAFRADKPLGPKTQTLRGELKKIMPLLRLVKNSVSGATAQSLVGSTHKDVGFIGTPSWPAGGGTTLSPNCAVDAP